MVRMRFQGERFLKFPRAVLLAIHRNGDCRCVSTSYFFCIDATSLLLPWFSYLSQSDSRSGRAFESRAQTKPVKNARVTRPWNSFQEHAWLTSGREELGNCRTDLFDSRCHFMERCSQHQRGRKTHLLNGVANIGTHHTHPFPFSRMGQYG
jgi:hypothetical protein